MTTATALTIFEFEGKAIRITKDEQGNPWWIVKDVCAYFGDTHYRRSISRLDADVKGVTKVVHPIGGTQEMITICEPGLYQLLFIMQPQKKKTMTDEQYQNRIGMINKFQRWVTHIVLPQIRRTGAYAEPGSVLQAMTKAADALLKMTEYLGVVDRRLTVIEQRQTAPTLLPPPVREASVRRRINQIVRDFVKRHSGSYEDTWNDLYRDFYYRYHIDLKTKASHRPGWSPLDIAEDGGIINGLFSLAVHLYAGK